MLNSTKDKINTFLLLLTKISSTVDAVTFKTHIEREPKSFAEQFKTFTPEEFDELCKLLVNDKGYMVPQTCKIIKQHPNASMQRDGLTKVVTLTVDGVEVVIYNKEYCISSEDLKRSSWFSKLIKKLFS